MTLVVQYKYHQSLECPKKPANPNILSTTTYLTFSNTNFYVLQTCITQSRERRGLMKSTKEFWSKKQFDKSSHYSDWLISRTHHSKGRKNKEVCYPMLLRQLKVYSMSFFFHIYSCRLMFIALACKVFFFLI